VHLGHTLWALRRRRRRRRRKEIEPVMHIKD
jgi:hypothetical protein